MGSIEAGQERDSQRQATPREQVESLLRDEPSCSPRIRGFVDFAQQVVTATELAKEYLAEQGTESVLLQDLLKRKLVTIDRTMESRRSGPDADAYKEALTVVQTQVFPSYVEHERVFRLDTGLHETVNPFQFCIEVGHGAAVALESDLHILNRAKRTGPSKPIQK